MDKAWGKLTPQLRNMFTLGKSHTVGMLASRGNFPRLRLGNQCRLACGQALDPERIRMAVSLDHSIS